MNRTAKNATLYEKLQPPITPVESSVSTSSSPSQFSDQITNQNADPEESFGRISIEDNQVNYVGQNHWTAILDNVSAFPCSRPGRPQGISPDFHRSPS
jgi:hypothetical protein